jgi:hypothetical protein
MASTTALKDFVKAIRSAFSSEDLSSADLEAAATSYLASNPPPSAELSDDLVDVFLRPSPSSSAPLSGSTSEINAFVRLLHRLALADALPKRHTCVWVWDRLLGPLLATSPASISAVTWEGVSLPRETWTRLREVWSWCWDDNGQDPHPSSSEAPATAESGAGGKREAADEWGELERRIVSSVIETSGKLREVLLMIVARSKAKVCSLQP